jgi:general secretion pathway protein G
MMIQKQRYVRGFTFIEIIVAVAILAILAAIVVPRVIGRVDDAAMAKARADIQALATAINVYKLDNFSYPSTDQGIQALITKPGGQPEAPNWRTGGYLGQNAVPKSRTTR